jgi:ribosome-binding factor A
MPSHRTQRVAEAIREVVASAILFEVADPRVKGVTVLSVDVTGDLRNATVHVTVMGTEAEQVLALRGLQHAAGFLQSRVAARLQTRFTPILSFKKDEGVKKSVALSRLIDEALASDRKPQTPPDPPDEPPSGDQD